MAISDPRSMSLHEGTYKALCYMTTYFAELILLWRLFQFYVTNLVSFYSS